ncbi:MAG: N-acetylmuramoyl-L-alanine amidase [Acidimicrobiia bacterium]
MIRTARRLLLIPAVGLLMLGAPALALDSTPAPPPSTTDVPLALPADAGPGARAEANASADLVGVKWAGDPGAEFKVEVQRPGSDRWEDAGTLGGEDTAPDADSPDARASLRANDGANASEPLAVGDVSDVRITVVSGSVDTASVVAVSSEPTGAPSGSAGALGFGGALPDGPDRFAYAVALVLGGLVLGAVAAGWSPWRSRRQIALLAVLSLVVLAACTPPSPNATNTPQPPVTMRSSWGPDLPWNPSDDCAPGPELAGTVNFIVVHHTVNSNDYSPSQSREWVRNIWAYHRYTLGYCDIAYNFIIDKYGQIFEGRMGGIDKAVIAAHTGGFNIESSGIALLGNFTDVQPTAAAWNALVDLAAWKLSVHFKNPADGFTAVSNGYGARWPAGTSVSFPSRIVGHRDLWPTACPGNAFYPRLAELRTVVQPRVGWEQGAPPPPPPTASTTTVPSSTTSTSLP